jgi:beta-lactamase class A
VLTLDRRRVIAGALGAVWVATAATRAAPAPLSKLEELEMRSRGRLGVAFLDTASGLTLSHRATERFPMCSTFKLLAVAAVLSRADRHAENLDRFVPYSSPDLITYSPVTSLHVRDKGMSVRALCEAAITQSDNTAANLLLAAIGGPAGVTRFARSIGDHATRLDRTEPSLNEAVAGDPRDTTTPNSMLGNLRSLLLGNALSVTGRDTLLQWLRGNQTGGARLRAGLPAEWSVGDKTGSGENGTTNDIAIAWPPSRPPVLMAAYLTGSPLSGDERNAVLADVARAVSARPAPI